MSIEEKRLTAEVRDQALLLLATLGIHEAGVMVVTTPVHVFADGPEAGPASWMAGIAVRHATHGQLGHAASGGATRLQALQRLRKHLEVP